MPVSSIKVLSQDYKVRTCDAGRQKLKVVDRGQRAAVAHLRGHMVVVDADVHNTKPGSIFGVLFVTVSHDPRCEHIACGGDGKFYLLQEYAAELNRSEA